MKVNIIICNITIKQKSSSQITPVRLQNASRASDFDINYMNFWFVKRIYLMENTCEYQTPIWH